MFGFDWARGFIAPFADRDGVPFATPSDAVEAILGIVLSARDGVVASPSLMDLGSGDGRIVLAAACVLSALSWTAASSRLHGQRRLRSASTAAALRRRRCLR